MKMLKLAFLGVYSYTSYQLSAACCIYLPELFTPLEPQEFLDCIIVPHVSTFLMS